MKRTAGPIITKQGRCTPKDYKGVCTYCGCEFMYNKYDVDTRTVEENMIVCYASVHQWILHCPQKGCGERLIMYSDSPRLPIKVISLDDRVLTEKDVYPEVYSFLL